MGKDHRLSPPKVLLAWMHIQVKEMCQQHPECHHGSTVQRVALEMVGPPPKLTAEYRNMYILTICYGTRYPEGVPQRTTKLA